MRREILLWIIVALVATSNVVSHVQIGLVQAHQNDTLQRLVCRGYTFTKHAKPPVESAAQRAAALKFYRGAIKDGHLKPCD